jgi:hypothetical protein
MPAKTLPSKHRVSKRDYLTYRQKCVISFTVLLFPSRFAVSWQEKFILGVICQV